MVLLQGVGIIIQMLTNIIFARHLDKESFGELSIFMSLILLLAVPLINPFYDLTIREISSKSFFSEKRKQYINFLIFSQLLISSFFCLLAYFFLNLHYTFEISINLIMNTVMFSILSLVTAYERGANKVFYSQLLFAIIFPSLYLIFVIFSIINNISDLGHYLNLRFYSSFIVSAIFFILMKPRASIMVKIPSKNIFSEYFSSSLSFFLVSGSGVIAKNFHIVLISSLLAISSSAEFRVATLFATIFIQLFNIIGILTQTEFAKDEIFNGANLKKLLRRTYLPLLILSLVLFLLAIFFMPFITETIFGNEYVDSSHITVMLCLSYLLPILFGPVSFLLLMNGDEKFVSNTLILSTILNLFFSYVFINLFGLVGACVGIIISMLVWNIIFTSRCYARFNMVPNLFYIIKD